MEHIAKKIIEECVQPSGEDRILVVADTSSKSLAESIFSYCKRKDLCVELLVMSPTEADGQEPESYVTNAMHMSDIIIAATKWSLSHTKPMVKARKRGAKVISMPSPEQKMLERCLNIDFKKLELLTKQIARNLTIAKEVRITTPRGTDLIVYVDGFAGNSFDGIARKGNLINLPDGEANIGIQDADGILVIDGSMSPDQEGKWGCIGKIAEPIFVTIQNGKAIKISGGAEADVLKAMFKHFGESVTLAAELGIGTNPNALLTGNVTEDEKVLGTVHIAFGDNTSFGGTHEAPLHLDGIVLYPTLKLDDFVILENGKLKI